jgi:anti-anti-sigma factor
MDAGQGRQRAAGAITIEREGADRWVLCLQGDVDTAVATRFTSAQGRQRVVVDAIDAGDVTFISSSGLALMLLCVEASVAAGRHPVLRAASRPVDRALELSGIEVVFPRAAPGEPQPPTGEGSEEPG